MWAALIARLNQALAKPLGFFNPTLYGALAYGVLRDVVYGNNGAYAARPGWDACTGLGSPDGVNLLAALMAIRSRAVHSSSVPEPSPALEPFRSAHEAFMGALKEAWRAVPSDGMGSFVTRASSAYGTYVSAVQQAWKEINTPAVGIASLSAIGQSIISAAGQAAMVSNCQTGGTGWKPSTG